MKPIGIGQEMVQPYRLSVAPMMAWTDRHCRYFHRLLAPHALLYTEMVTTGALLHSDPRRFLDHHADEHPLALQLGGSEPQDLADAVKIATDWRFDEINLNCGCPSERVQRGAFGACLMTEPELVAECVSAMREASDVPVTVKCRIGVDEQDDFAFLERFVGAIENAGCHRVIVHARKAWLKGLSPKQNREIPLLDYERVGSLKQRFGDLAIILNGGIKDPALAASMISAFDGVMIGREAYQNPYSLIEFDNGIFGCFRPQQDRFEILQLMVDYAWDQAKQHVPVRDIARHMLGLFNGRPGARGYRRSLSEAMQRHDATPQILNEAAQWCRSTSTQAAA